MYRPYQEPFNASEIHVNSLSDCEDWFFPRLGNKSLKLVFNMWFPQALPVCAVQGAAALVLGLEGKSPLARTANL
jgi:hypothetical protein